MQKSDGHPFVTWTRSGKVFLSLQTRPEIASSAQRAIEVANRELNASGFSSTRVRNLKVYTIPSRGTEEALKAHLVIVGNVPPPPMQFGVTAY